MRNLRFPAVLATAFIAAAVVPAAASAQFGGFVNLPRNDFTWVWGDQDDAERGRGRDINVRGIDRGLAQSAVDAAYREIDEDALIERALARRLRGPIDSPAALRRLYHHLVRQGFDGAAARAALAPHTAAAARDGVD